MRLEEALAASRSRHPERCFLVCDERRLSFAEFDDLATDFARALRALGVGRHDRVIIFHDNAPEAAVAIYGANRAGGVFSLVNPQTKAEKLAFVIKKLRPRVVVSQLKLLPTIREALKEVLTPPVIIASDADSDGDAGAKVEGVLSFSSAMKQGADSLVFPGIDADIAYVAFTSGSTGVPKGAVMTHQASISGARSMIEYLEVHREHVVLSVVPLSFDYGLYQLLMAGLSGSTLILERGLSFPKKLVARIRDEKVTGLPLVPTSIAFLLRVKEFQEAHCPDLAFITTTAAPLPPAHSQRLQSLFPRTRIFSNYGLTEVVRATYLPPEDLASRPTSVGRAMPNSEAFVVDEQGRRCGAGEVGELVFRGASTLKGYWENDDATHAALRPGTYPWDRVFHTGDLFREDEDGYLYYVGRIDDIFKSRGEKISPKEIENTLYMLPSITEATVFGVPHPMLGNAIVAVLSTSADAAPTTNEIKRHCASHLEDFMVPTYVELRDELPKTDSGKIDRRRIRELWLDAHKEE